jgi:hypothetical protein
MRDVTSICATACALIVCAAIVSCSAAPASAESDDVEINRAYAAANDSAEAWAHASRQIDARTHVEIRGEDFWINGRPTYAGRGWRGARIEGLLLNARMAQGVFDDLNPATRDHWAYPDTGRWDPGRNTQEFIEAIPSWRASGLLAVSVNLQGGNAHADNERWVNTAFGPDGAPHPAYFERMRRIIEATDHEGMAVILGLFYFRHDEALANEAAVINAVDSTINWLHAIGATNVVIEVNNECDIRYDHAILRCDRVAELMQRVRENARDGARYLVSTSLQGGAIPPDAIIAASDFILLHGNGVEQPSGIDDMVRRVRRSRVWSPKPIVFNEDDHYGFGSESNNFTAAIRSHASWGYYDRRRPGEPVSDGFQTVPVDWSIDSPRKRAFFSLVREMSGETR